MASSSSRVITVVTATTVGTLGLLCTVWLHRSVRDHGWDGTIRYIWEGDYYTPDVRDALDELETIETNLQSKVSQIELIETSYERAKLNSVDDEVKKEDWTLAHSPNNLEKDLAMLSYDLDKAAAEVDAVLSKHNDVRPRKKILSNEIVKLMSRADGLLKIYQEQKNVT